MKSATVFLSIVLAASTALAQATTVDVEIKSVDPTARTITVEHNGKTTELDISRKATIVIAGKDAEASAIIPGDKAKIEYHKDLQVVTKIEAEGSVQGGWRFIDMYGKNVDHNRAIVVARDGRLVCNGSVGGFCLTSLTEHSEFTVKLEFQFLLEDFKGGPFVSVASTLPNPEATDWKEQIPRGIEVKLHPRNAGELTLPTPDFKVELPLGQLRDGRKVVPLRPADVKAKDWNTLEVTVDEHSNVAVKINGTQVNAVAKVEKTKGYILIVPQNAEMHLRNAVLIKDGAEKPLSFDTIVTE